jgi:DNA-binding beta-propeller fold protein YncE
LTADAVLGADAGLKEPRGIGVDAAGNIYVGDSGNHRIVRLDPSGKLAGEWGGATTATAPGQFNLLADLAVRSDGQVVSLDAGNGDIQAFTPAGANTLYLPHAASSASGIAVQAEGAIWLADTGGGRVARFTPDGKLAQTLLGGEPGTTKRLEQPVDVAVAPDGTAYVVDLRGRIARLDANGIVTQQWRVEVGITRGGSHLAVWKNLVVMTDPDRNRLVILDPADGTIRFAGGPGTASGQFRLPIGLAAGPDGKLYVVDSDNARVQVFSSLETR